MFSIWGIKPWDVLQRLYQKKGNAILTRQIQNFGPAVLGPVWSKFFVWKCSYRVAIRVQPAVIGVYLVTIVHRIPAENEIHPLQIEKIWAKYPILGNCAVKPQNHVGFHRISRDYVDLLHFPRVLWCRQPGCYWFELWRSAEPHYKITIPRFCVFVPYGGKKQRWGGKNN